MKIVRFSAGGRARYGVLAGDTIEPIEGKPFHGIKRVPGRFKLGEVRLLAPCVPSKIVAMGLNYRTHAEEVHLALPEVPLFFLKPPTSVTGPEDEIHYPPSSTRVDYEGELAVVIGRKAWQVSREQALEHVFGYTILNDVSARDHQKQDVQWTRAKGFDTFAPVGPWIETELDPSDVTVETWLNGELKQHASTKDLIFPIAEQISFISHVMTLLPGDVIATGTPDGIGPMKPGDVVEIRIPPIGTLRNRVVMDDGKPHR